MYTLYNIYKKVSVLGVALFVACFLSLAVVGMGALPVEAQTPTFTANSVGVWEDAGTVDITVSIPSASTTDTTVGLSTISMRACGGAGDRLHDENLMPLVDHLGNPLLCFASGDGTFDYTGFTDKIVTIPAGQTSVTTQVTIVDDTILSSAHKPNGESFAVKIVSVNGAVTTSGDTIKVTIWDQDFLVTAELGDYSVSESAGSLDVTFTLSRPLPSPVVVSIVALNLSARSADYTIPATVTFPAGEVEVTATIAIHDNDRPGDDFRLFQVRILNPSLPHDHQHDSFTVVIANDDLYPPCPTLPIEIDEGGYYAGAGTACALSAPWPQTGTAKGTYLGLAADGTESTTPPPGVPFYWGIGQQGTQQILAWGGVPFDDDIVHGHRTISATLHEGTTDEYTGEIFKVMEDDVSIVHVEWQPQRTWDADPGQDLVITVPVRYPGTNFIVGRQTLTITAKTDQGGPVDVSFRNVDPLAPSTLTPTYTPPSGGVNGELVLVRQYTVSQTALQHDDFGPSLSLDAYQVAKYYNAMADVLGMGLDTFTVTAGGPLEGIFYDKEKCLSVGVNLPTLCHATAGAVPLDASGTITGPRDAGFEPGVLTVRTGRAVTLEHNGKVAQVTALLSARHRTSNRVPIGSDVAISEKVPLNQANQVFTYRSSRYDGDSTKPYVCSADTFHSLALFVFDFKPYYEFIRFTPGKNVFGIVGNAAERRLDIDLDCL